jgi:hypothetical protein
MKGLILFTLLVISVCASGQVALPVPENIKTTFLKGTRSENGKPGGKYWQNSADYELDIHFYPETRLLTGTASITYINNSPDTLKEILFKLYPNLYKKGSPRDNRIDENDVNDGIIIDQMMMNNRMVNLSSARMDATNMSIRSKVNPGETTRFYITYHYTLNQKSHNRTGEVEPNSDFVAYFFPRVAVYDDIDGWNRYPYLGTAEFYNDFCNFKASITVPKNFLVWATGDLTNCGEVLAPTYCQRIQQAEQNDDVVYIVDSADLKKGGITADHATNTWKFEAKNVTDLVFATSDHYVWRSTSVMVDPSTKRRTRVDAVFNPKHKDYYQVVFDARKTVEAMSYNFPKWPFPYPHETVFDGLDQMEYPMMVNDNPLEDREQSIELTDHEIFHTMFPFYMGINETKYAWMDEGWATIGEWLISPMIDTSIVDTYGVARYAAASGTESDLPITTLSALQSGTAYFVNSYPKPAMGYLYVKEMLGDDLFHKALHHYIRTWNGKHPMPYDFFNSMNEGAGRNMNWFWKRWFFDNGYPDLGITTVNKKGNGWNILITAKGTKPVPVVLNITYTDGSKQVIRRDVSAWEKGYTTVNILVPTGKSIQKIELGDAHVPDKYKQDNVYEVK